MNPRVLPPYPEEPALRADEVSPHYLRVLRMIEACTAAELSRLKLYDLTAIQKRKMEVEITRKEKS